MAKDKELELLDWFQEKLQHHWLMNYGGRYGDVIRSNGFTIFFPVSGEGCEYDKLRIFRDFDIQVIYNMIHALENEEYDIDEMFYDFVDEKELNFDHFNLVEKTKTDKEPKLENL